jgi:hypothetical protein
MAPEKSQKEEKICWNVLGKKVSMRLFQSFREGKGERFLFDQIGGYLLKDPFKMKERPPLKRKKDPFTTKERPLEQ